MKKTLCLLFFICATLQVVMAQKAPVSVTVTDETGAGLPGASVLIKGSTEGGVTNASGKLTINAAPTAVLQISSVGYQTAEISVGNRTTITHQMAGDVTNLNEVVVTGYVTEEKKDIVGSVSVVKVDQLLSTPSGNVTTQLQGRSPGVTVSTDGTPGGSAKVRIRGFGSFSGSDPLYVIDGVPVTVNGNNTASPIDNLNPNDIESLQVLKDAAASSIYGARAANGVVIITTKHGKTGTSAKVTFDAYYATNYVSKNNFPDMLNAQEYANMYWGLLKGAHETLLGSSNPADRASAVNFTPGGSQWTHPQYGTGPTPVLPEYIYVLDNGNKRGGAYLEALRASDPAAFNALVDPANYNFETHQIVKAADTDWFRETFKPAPQQSYQIGVTGGGSYGNYALSANVFDQVNTTSKYGIYKRYTVRSNSMFKAGRNIRLGENLQLGYTKQRDGVPVNNVWTMTASIPVYDIMGNPASSAAPGLVAVGTDGRNPITEAWRNRMDSQQNYTIFGNLFAEVDFMKGLTGRTSFGVDFANRSILDFTPVTYEHAENTAINAQQLSSANNSSISWTWSNTLTYSKTFAQKHNFKILVGTEAIKASTQTLQAIRRGTNNVPAYATEDPDFLVIDAGIGTQTNSGIFSRNSLFSLFGRVDYSYADKYLFNATLRQDASSKFGPENRVGYFPAAALGWRISSEEFLKSVSWLNDLKLRASYGVIGNQNGLPNNNRYTVYQQALTEGYALTGANTTAQNSYTVSSLGNPGARWERNITANLGLDGTLFDNSLDVSFEVYQKKTDGLLVQNQAPRNGFSGTQPYINAGNMTNKGIELGLTKRGKVEGLRYEVSVNFSRYKNNVTKVLDNPLATVTGGNTRLSTPAALTAVGHPIAQYYGFKLDGFFNTQEEVNAYNEIYNPNNTTTPWIPPAVGRWRIKDVNGDKVINDLDRTFIGSPHPNFQMGFNVNLNYKNFDLTGFVFWNQGGQLFNFTKYNVDFNTFNYNRSARMLYDSWRPDHMNAQLPKLDFLDTYSNKFPTDYYVENASYVRLKTLQLGYNVPKAWLSRVKIEKLRVYLQAQNLLTAKKTNNLDPDVALSGGDTSMGVVNGVNPTPKQLLLGINLGF